MADRIAICDRTGELFLKTAPECGLGRYSLPRFADDPRGESPAVGIGRGSHGGSVRLLAPPIWNHYRSRCAVCTDGPCDGHHGTRHPRIQRA